jgi:hypothetical protein
MPIWKKVPWVSLALVLLSYSTLGWVISETKTPVFVWFIAVFAVLLLVGGLTNPWLRFTEFSSVFFRSSTRSFLFAVCLAFLFFVILAWFRVFLDALLIISTTILARIDFQATGFGKGQTFGMLSVISFVGLAVGAGIQILVVS